MAVVGYFIIGAIHPAEIEVGDETTLYIGIHLVQPFFILLLAWGIWLLVKDLPGRAAQVARIAIVPYAIAYSMFDAIAGVALGGIVRLANDASAADGAVVQRLMDTGDGLRRRSSSLWRRTCPGSSWPLPPPSPSSRSAGAARRC